MIFKRAAIGAGLPPNSYIPNRPDTKKCPLSVATQPRGGQRRTRRPHRNLLPRQGARSYTGETRQGRPQAAQEDVSGTWNHRHSLRRYTCMARSEPRHHRLSLESLRCSRRRRGRSRHRGSRITEERHGHRRDRSREGGGQENAAGRPPNCTRTR